MHMPDLPSTTGHQEGHKPLSILHVLGSFPVLSETFVSNEIRAMRKRGHRIVPIALQPYDGPCQPEDAIFRTETIALGDIPAAAAIRMGLWHPLHLRSAWQFARAQAGLRPRSLMLAGMRVALLARSRGCTHLHAHFALPATATAIVAARLAGATCSFTGHGYDIYGSPADLPLKLRSADLAIAVCEDMRRDMLALAPRANVQMVPCGIDPDRFRPASDTHENGRLLAIGRLVEQKGYDVLMAAMAKLAPADRPMIDIVGAGALEQQISDDIRRLGLASHVRLLGARTSAWIAAEGPAYRGFVAPYRLTSNGDRDTGPVVVKEAMAMGLPVVASSLMGLKETVDDACGRQVPTNDPDALAHALIWLSRLSPEDRWRFGRAGRARIRSAFSIAAQAEGLETAIQALRR